MKIYINGTKEALVIQGVTYSQEVSAERPLDVITFRYISYTQTEALTSDTLVRIVASANDDVYMLVQSDAVEKHSKIVDAYIHTVNCIECTSYLDRFQMSNPTYTLKQYRYTSGGIVVSRPTTMWEYLNMAIMNAEPLSARTCRFSFSLDVQTLFATVPSEDIFLKSPCTLRDVLDRMLLVRNYRCYVAKIEDFNSITIGFRTLNPQGQLVEFENVVNEVKSNDSQYHYGKTVTDIKNGISQDVIAVHGWDLIRPTGSGGSIIQFTNSVFGIANLMPIQEVKHFYQEYTLSVDEISGQVTPNTYTVVIDLAVTTNINDVNKSYGIIDRELYDLLTPSQKERFIPYTRNTNKLGDLIYSDWIGINHTVFTRIMNTVFNYTFLHKYDSNHADTGGLDVVSLTPVYERTPGFTESPNWMNSAYSITAIFSYYTNKYKIEYIPYINTRLTLSNPNVKAPTSQYSNQDDSNISIERYSRQLQDKVNQSGNATIIKDCVAYDILDVHSIGDYTSDQYVITSREIAFGEGYYKCHYVLSKYFLNSQLKAGLDRDRRLYDIPLEPTEQEINVTDYIELSTTEKATTDQTFLKQEGVKAILQGFEGTAHDTIKKIACLTSASQSNGTAYILDGNSFIFGRSIVWLWTMFDNYSFDLGVAQRVLGGQAVAYNPYVNKEDGTIHVDGDTASSFTKNNEWSFIWLSGVTSEENGDLTNRALVNWFDNNEGADSFMAVSYYKDPFVMLKGSIQAEFVSNEEKIIIGDSIAKYCNLYQDMSQVNLYLWSSTRKYTYLDKTCIGTKGSAISPTIDTTNNSLQLDLTSLPTGSKSYAIGTSDGELLFAVNDVEVDTIYFSIKRER